MYVHEIGTLIIISQLNFNNVFFIINQKNSKNKNILRKSKK